MKDEDSNPVDSHPNPLAHLSHDEIMERSKDPTDSDALDELLRRVDKPLPDLPEDGDVDQDPSESDDEDKAKRAKADAIDALVKELDVKRKDSEESSDEIQIVKPPSRPKRNRQPVKRFGH